MDMSLMNQVIAIVENYVPRNLTMYCIESYTHNDPCHNVGHMLGVLKEAEYFCTKDIKLDSRDKKLLYTAILMHDLGCRYDRKTHHLISYGMSFKLMEELGQGFYDKDEMMIVALAVKEHRSSGDGKYSTIISELVALADKGKPNLDKYITAAVLYRKNLKIPRIFKIQSVINHLVDKFSESGYCWDSYPSLGRKLYKDEIDVLIESIKDEEYLRLLVKEKIRVIESHR